MTLYVGREADLGPDPVLQGVSPETRLQHARELIEDYLESVGRPLPRSHDLQMGQSIETKGCGRCGGTMYKTVEVNDQGQKTSETQYVCQRCGAVE